MGDSLLKMIPQKTSIAQLLSEKRAALNFESNDTLRYPDEKRVVSVDAVLVKIKTGNDHDFHLVLQSSDGLYMVAEVPDGNCGIFKNHPAQKKVFNDLRQQIISTIGFTPGAKFTDVNKNVTVEGIPFWDKIKEGHSPKYGSADKHEIHPVTRIVFLN